MPKLVSDYWTTGMPHWAQLKHTSLTLVSEDSSLTLVTPLSGSLLVLCIEPRTVPPTRHVFCYLAVPSALLGMFNLPVLSK